MQSTQICDLSSNLFPRTAFIGTLSTCTMAIFGQDALRSSFQRCVGGSFWSLLGNSIYTPPTTYRKPRKPFEASTIVSMMTWLKFYVISWLINSRNLLYWLQIYNQSSLLTMHLRNSARWHRSLLGNVLSEKLYLADDYSRLENRRGSLQRSY